MAWFNKSKEKPRYYLLPGQGGPASRQKQKMMLQWALITGVIVSAALALLLYFMNRPLSH